MTFVKHERKLGRSVPLGEIAKFIRGITFKPEDPVPVGSKDSVVCMRTKNVQRDLDESDLIALPPEFVARDEQYLRKGDLLVSSANSWNLVGKCSWVPELNYLATAGGFISILRANTDRLVPRYLYYWFSSPLTQEQVRACGRQTTNISNLDFNRCLTLEIPLPSSGDQQRIASILDKADAVQQMRQRQVDNVEKLIHSTFMEIVGPKAHGYPTWKTRRIDSLASSSHGSMRTGPFGSDLKHSEFVDNGIAVLGIDNAVRNQFAWSERRFITAEKFEKLHRYRVYPGDVIVTIMGTTGRSAVVPDDIPIAITTKHLATITLDREQAEPEFISNAIHRHPEVLRQIRSSNRGAIMDGLNLGLIRSLEVPVPPPTIQREFAIAVDQVRKLGSRMNRALEESDRLFNSLVSRAFRGEL